MLSEQVIFSFNRKVENRIHGEVHMAGCTDR